MTGRWRIDTRPTASDVAFNLEIFAEPKNARSGGCKRGGPNLRRRFTAHRLLSRAVECTSVACSSVLTRLSFWNTALLLDEADHNLLASFSI